MTAYDDREYYINLIVQKLYNAFQHNRDFLLDISIALKERVEGEIRFEKIYDERNLHNDTKQDN